MTVRELREKYLRFFEGKGHRRYPSGSLIPTDVTGRLDESLLFNGAGMIQFKPYFRGVAKPDHPRLITCQKCVRTNDIEEVGDATHLTFFEMLGNFSFGDYFKEEAIRYSWEFLTSPEWLGLDLKRLSFTVFEIDDEAERVWRACGAAHVFRLGEETNYWPAGAFSNGPPGPCGPNSEMFYWVGEGPAPTGDYSREDWRRDEAEGNWVEIWNDVFIQYEWQGEPEGKGYRKTGMPELPFRSIDTGMGLDRTAFVLGGLKSVYDTDAFAPIFRLLDEISGSQSDSSGAVTAARRIIADHIRTATFCIADGILPGNTGRGYVLRRLIRRAVLKGDRTLRIQEPFFYRLFEAVFTAMGDAYAELSDRRAVITETLRNEELLFRRTLKEGSSRLQTLLSESTIINGEDAFRLYDTYGFPLEITRELAHEAGVAIDDSGYEEAMREAQARSRGAQELDTVYGGVQSGDIEGNPEPTRFLGYGQETTDAVITGIRRHNGRTYVALDQTVLYGESGGQVGDTGWIGGAEVLDTTKAGGIWWHEVDQALPLGTEVEIRVDTVRRARIRSHHTATHLLHLALREALGDHATQAGSYVGPDRLRFDFTHGSALTPEQRLQIEARVNQLALENADVTTYVDISPAEAKARGAMALFGEKYGDKVRMVEVGASRELCGGTHVRTAAQILPFRILSEASAASGVRRIEAVAGAAAIEIAHQDQARIIEAASLLKSTSHDLVPAVERVLTGLRDERVARERAERAALSGGANGQEQSVKIGNVNLWVRDFGDANPKLATEALDNVIAHDSFGFAFIATQSDGKLQFAAKAGADAVKAGAHAGKLVGEIAKIAGGGGGGRPDFATAGGRQPERLTDALAAIEPIVRGQLGT